MLAALDELASTIMTVMVLFTSMSVTVFLKLWGLALWTDVSDHHGVDLRWIGMRFWSTITQHRQPSITWSALPSVERKALWLGEVKWLGDRKRIISVTEDGITLYVCSLRVRVLYFRSVLRARVLYLPCKPLTSGLES